MDQFRERAKRLSDIRSLGQQVAQIRRTGLRGEIIVPILALLILTAALGLSALSSPSLETPSSTPVIGSEVAGLEATPVSTPSPAAAGSYPAPLPSATDSILAPEASPELVPDETAPSLDETAMAGGEPGEDLSSGYPNPNDGPQGVDPAPDTGLPSVPPPPDSAPPPSTGSPNDVPTPALIPMVPTTPPSTGGGSNDDDGSNNNGYPAPPANPPTNNNPTQPTVAVENDATPVSGTTEPTNESAPETATTETASPTDAATSTPAATPIPPTPTARPAKVLSGNLRWTVANSPVILNEDQLLAADSSLTIDPGVEVQLGPNVRLTIAGTLRAQGTGAAPIRMAGPNGRWDGLVGAQGSTITLDNVQIRQAGRAGTALSSTGGTLVVRNSAIADSGGGIVAIRSAVDVRGTQISGNAIGGPVINVQLAQQAGTTISGNVIGGNGTPAGAPQVLLIADKTAGPIGIEGNLIFGSPGAGQGVVLNTNIPLSGTIRCNSFNGGTVGLQLSANLPDATGFNLAIDNNAFAGQTQYGATGTAAFNVTNNWWGDASGPADARRNAQGRGVPVGVNLQFQPWLNARPGCAPSQ